MNIETKEKYYTCRYDRPFKEIFLKERNKDLLKDLLELILNVKINNITLGPNERNTGSLRVKRKTYDALLYTDIGKIEIEVNANNKKYIYPRNMAYICDLYSHHTLVKESYNQDTIIMQINLSYELGKKNKAVRVYTICDEEGEKFVKNFEIIQINMDYFVNLWYDRENVTKEEIGKNRLLIMLGLGRENLEKFSKYYEEVNRFMGELDKLNMDVEFREYMSEEEDKRKIFNSEINEARKTGFNDGFNDGFSDGVNKGSNDKSIEIAKKLIEIDMDIKNISEITGLSIEEIEKLS